MAINTLRPLRPRRAILLRKDAQLGLFGGETEVKPTAAAKRRERMLQPKAPPKPPKPSTRATAPKEGDTRINRAGNEEVLRAGRWRLASNPKVVAKDKGSTAIVPVVEAEKGESAKPVESQEERWGRIAGLDRESGAYDDALEAMPDDEQIAFLRWQTIQKMKEWDAEPDDSERDRSRQKEEGLVIGSRTVNVDENRNPPTKIIQQFRMRTALNGLVLESRYLYLNANDPTKLTDGTPVEKATDKWSLVRKNREDRWSEDELLSSMPELMSLDTVLDPVAQKKIDDIKESDREAEEQERREAREAQAAKEAKEKRKAKDLEEFQQWINSDVYSRYRAKKKTIDLPVVNADDESGTRQVEALTYGDIAVHKTVGGRKGYTITHIPTGMEIYGTTDQAIARKAAIIMSHEIAWKDNIDDMDKAELQKAAAILLAFENNLKPSFAVGEESTEDEPATELKPKKKNSLSLSPVQQALNEYNKTARFPMRVIKGTARSRAKGDGRDIDVYIVELHSEGGKGKGYWSDGRTIPVSRGKKELLEFLERRIDEMSDPFYKMKRPLPRRPVKPEYQTDGSDIDLVDLFSNPEKFKAEPTAVPAEVVDDAPKPTKLGDRIRAIANDLRDENDEQKKIAARILGAAAQMAQNYDNLVGEVVDMVGEDLGEDIRSLNPDATQADVEMVARDSSNEPPPTRLADKMKAIANDLRNETNEQVKATARILDAAAQIAQNYDNLVDEVAEMVGEDLEAGGGAIAPVVDEPMVEAEESQEEKFERIYSLSTGKRLKALNELSDDEWQAYSEWEKNKGSEPASPPEPQEKNEPVAEEEKDDLLSDPFAADISLSMAQQAYAGTSFDPEKGGKNEIRDYVQHLRAVQNSLSNIAETPEQQAVAAAEFERYRQGYQRRYTDSLARRGRIVSPMIVGPARFPVDQMEKRRGSYERSINEMLEWSDRAQNAAKKAVLAAAPGGDPTAPISSDDPDAIKKLQAQIDAAEKRQAAMKAGNKIVVDKTLTDDQKLAKLIELGIEESDAKYALRRDGADSRPYGFQRFQFSNNSANIRRMKQRIATLEKRRSQSTRSITVGDIEITDDVEANRLRLVFPSKPSSEVRDKLKRSGFRWSPKEGAWQRMRSNDAIYAAEQALGIKLTKSLPPGPVFTLMGVPYIFDPHRAVLRKAGTSWEQFVADLSKEADDDPCWDGYEAVGMKKKRGKMVPNCVPVNLNKTSQPANRHNEGELKTENGVTYRLNANSRWEKVDSQRPTARPQQIVPTLQDNQAQPSIDEITQKDARENYEAHKEAYLEENGMYDAEGNLKGVVLNTDDWRTRFPQYTGTNAADVHEASSYLNKRLYNEMLPAMKGKGNGRMLVLAGGGGSGKGTATRRFFDQSDYPIVLDQASDNYPKLEAKIDEAIAAGYTPEHVFIDRAPEDALGGIAQRAVNLHNRGKLPRTVPFKIGFKANIEARKATLALLKSRMDIDIKIVDNNCVGDGCQKLITDRQEAIRYLESRIAEEDRNAADGLEDKMHQKIVHRFLAGDIPEHIAKGLTSHEHIERAKTWNPPV